MGETPGRAGATLRPAGRLVGSVVTLPLVFGGPSVLSTERLGIVGLMFGVPGAVAVLEPMAERPASPAGAVAPFAPTLADAAEPAPAAEVLADAPAPLPPAPALPLPPGPP